MEAGDELLDKDLLKDDYNEEVSLIDLITTTFPPLIVGVVAIRFETNLPSLFCPVASSLVCEM